MITIVAEAMLIVRPGLGLVRSQVHGLCLSRWLLPSKDSFPHISPLSTSTHITFVNVYQFITFVHFYHFPFPDNWRHLAQTAKLWRFVQTDVQKPQGNNRKRLINLIQYSDTIRWLSLFQAATKKSPWTSTYFIWSWNGGGSVFYTICPPPELEKTQHWRVGCAKRTLAKSPWEKSKKVSLSSQQWLWVKTRITRNDADCWFYAADR